MQKHLTFFLLLVGGMLYGQDFNTDFQSFRMGLLSDYNEFKGGILENYASYLDGIWEEFDTFRGVTRDNNPKPLSAPEAKNQPTRQPTTLPQPEGGEEEAIIVDLPTSKVIPPAVGGGMTTTTTPSKHNLATPQAEREAMVEVDFYGVTISLPRIDVYNLDVITQSAVAEVWRAYKSSASAESGIEALTTAIKEHRLPDWFVIELVGRYCEALTNNIGGGAIRVALQHYLLVGMGYNVRIGKTENSLVLLIPFCQPIYERSYVTIDGMLFYIFPDAKRTEVETFSSISTCQIPTDVDAGRVANLRLQGINSEFCLGNDIERSISGDGIVVNLLLNSNSMEMLRYYPQMDIAEYAHSVVSPALRKGLLEQIRPQIEGISQIRAANALLGFVQHGFKYATDQQQHGYEKPYFLEENFFYEKNDCEDRSILYAFLVEELLGLEVKLVRFPGHECTAVHFTDGVIEGDGFTFKGKRFLICDPTFIGAKVGRCMPQFSDKRPIIESSTPSNN